MTVHTVQGEREVDDCRSLACFALKRHSTNAAAGAAHIREGLTG